MLTAPNGRIRVWRRDLERETFEVVGEAERYYIGTIEGGTPEKDGVVILSKTLYAPVEEEGTTPDYYTYRAPNQRAQSC